MEQFRYIDNILYCEDTPLGKIAQEVGTPAYVYSKRSVIDHSRWIENALRAISHLSCYAVKANANRSILKLLADEGIGADVGSIGELRLALDANFPPSKITFSGVGKRDVEIEAALRHEIHSFNVESEEEIGVISEIAAQLHTEARVLLRVNFDIDAGTHPYTTTGTKHNKFGIASSRAEEVALWAKSLSGIKVIGIHSHLGSQITRSETFIAAARAALSLIDQLRRRGLAIEVLNFGGGFGVQYYDYVTHSLLPSETQASDKGLTTTQLLSDVLPILQSSGCQIMIQPGRSVIAHAGALLTRVLYRKESGGRTFVITDAGMNDLLRPSLYKSYHQIVPAVLRKERPHEVVDVVGPLCESGDFFALDRAIPRVNRNDLLCVLCAGAYGYVLTSNYNGRPRPPEVLVDGSHHEIAREAETIDQL